MRLSRLVLALLCALPMMGCSDDGECDTCSSDDDCQPGFVVRARSTTAASAAGPARRTTQCRVIS